MPVNVVRDVDKGYRELLARMNDLTKRPRGVFVGVRSKDGAEVEPGQSYNLAQIAAVNEFGTESQGEPGDIPARPFLRSTLDENVERYGRKLIDSSIEHLTGARPLERGLAELGVVAVSDVRRKITAIRQPPNAPATIAKKGSSNPLIDTGRLRASIDYEIRRIRE